MVKEFSQKQINVLNWWSENSKYRYKQAIICDGAVRSGKTTVMAISFVLWSFANFHQKNFAFCGRSVKSIHRNLVVPLTGYLLTIGFKVKFLQSQNILVVTYKSQQNYYYLFGGNNSTSSSIIQGITLAGAVFDEVPLMPRTFVEQTLARCSVDHSKFWFNCNPEHPSHWFYREWITNSDEKNAYYIHFSMEDNPSLSQEVLARYEKLFSGVFYQRFVKGIWTSSFGAVYPMFSNKYVAKKLPTDLLDYTVSCDYGTTNPTVFGLWGFSPKRQKWYRIKEYYHCSRTTGVIKTDSQYYVDLESFLKEIDVTKIIVDPSAASFIQYIRSKGDFNVTPAKNDVFSGIQLVSQMLQEDRLRFHKSCFDTLREFELYCWDMNSKNDKPLKQNDHCMDDIRYFVASLIPENLDSFYAVAKTR